MTRADQLVKVKQSLNITGTALDDPLGIYLDDVKLYMADAGVSATILDSESSVGAICRGVADLYVNGELSQYFYQRVTQLAIQRTDTPSGGTNNYNELDNLPTLNGTTIQGDLDSPDVGIDLVTPVDIIGLF